MTQAQGAAPQPEDAGKADPSGAEPESAAPEPTEPEPTEPEPTEPEPTEPEPPTQDDLKAKYREALAREQGSHGAADGGHGDRAAAPHGTNTGPGQRMFRRKSG